MSRNPPRPTAAGYAPVIIAITIMLTLCISSVTAGVVIDEYYHEYEVISKKGTIDAESTAWSGTNMFFRIDNIVDYVGMNYIAVTYSGNTVPVGFTGDGEYAFKWGFSRTSEPYDGVVYISRSRNILNQVTFTHYTWFFYDWAQHASTKNGTQNIWHTDIQIQSLKYSSDKPTMDNDFGIYTGTWSSPNGERYVPYPQYTIAVAGVQTWKNRLVVDDDTPNAYHCQVTRQFDGVGYYSVVSGGDVRNAEHEDAEFYIIRPVTQITVESSMGKIYTYPLDGAPDPGDPGDQPVLRKGTVTMTDHNGTSISGFEVTAVNRYTGESYTVTTDTDVAVMTLPLERTTEIRNPETGKYEVAPVGYYTFYGQASGYKMLFEDGIKVVVTPEKYDSYKLCDILVTSDSGPLTGKHKFQIKSRADNSILQTGTISAKSATTGEWYNTSVSGGIATLILPYDTTSVISEYAGLYYVYATSPGYEDSDYATQISVYPHTVSEIKTVLLTPIGGLPTPGNVTLRIQAVSETGTGVVNAQIFIAGVYGTGKDVWDTYTASSTGYLTVSVPGNSTYDIVASGDGYYDSARRIEVFTDDPGLIEIKLYLSGYPTITPPTQPTGWPTDPPTTPPTGGIPDEDDDSDGFMMESVRGIANLFGVSFGVGKTILGMLLALSIGTATAKHLRGGAQEFGMGMLGGVVLGVLIGLLPIWVLVLLVLIVGLWIGQRYMSGGDS